VPGTYVDIDGVGECVDTFRGMGLTEASDRCCCEGSAYLLRTQLKNGSFPLWFPEGQSATSHYDNLHSTWVCAMQPYACAYRDYQHDHHRTIAACRHRLRTAVRRRAYNNTHRCAHKRCVTAISRSHATRSGSVMLRSCCG
jgi:hypothetical protein